ncbi:MAG: glycosyltransferase [Bacillota bacterium]|nr:glycosyltransferase [Bacillota bacterium]
MISFVLPAYNEEANLPVLLNKIADAMSAAGRPYRVVAVNDGSRDGTSAILRRHAERMPVEVITHLVNLGLPRTIVDGLRHAADRGSSEDIIITMDADNSHEPSYAPAMIDLVERGFDVVIASRYQPGAREVGLSLLRRFLSYAVNRMLAVLLPIPGVRDYTCGYRAYRAGMLKRLFEYYGDRVVESTTFSAMAEILLKTGTLGARAAEVPLVLRYDQKRGGSKMKVVATILDYLRLMARLAPGWPQPRRVRR